MVLKIYAYILVVISLNLGIVAGIYAIVVGIKETKNELDTSKHVDLDIDTRPVFDQLEEVFNKKKGK